MNMSHNFTFNTLKKDQKMIQPLFESIATGIGDCHTFNLQSLSLLEAQPGHSFTSFISDSASNTNESSLSQGSIPFDEDDVFQCGRCKKQFTSLPLFAHHKREECRINPSTSKISNRLDNNPKVLEVSGSAVISQSSHQLDEICSQVLTSIPHGEGSNSSVYLNSLNSTPLFHITPSVVLGEETLSFIPIDQNGQLSHFVSGHAGSQVISVSENDLNTLINSGDRFHIQSIDQMGPSNSTSSIYLTASVISPSGKGSNVQIIANLPQEEEYIPSERRLAISETVESSYCGSSKLMSPTKDSTPLSKPHDHEAAKKSEKSGTSKDSNMHSSNVETEESKKPKKVRQSKGQTLNNPPATKQQRKCDYCGKQFKKLFNLHQHIRSHTGEKPFHCLVCGRGFTQKSNVKKHMQTHKVWPKIKSTLPKEQLSIKVKDNIDSSADLADGEEVEYVVNNIYVCQYCESIFENYHKLKTHLSHVHKHEKLFKCIHKDCVATFSEVEKLISHMKIHEAELEYQCQNCPKKFRTLFDLGAHQYCHRLYPNKISSSPPKQYRCSKCNSKYASAEALNHHLLTSSHSYPCSLCHLTFVCERYLRRHLRIHGTGEQFKCELCGKMFKTENYLKSHLVIHSDVKPFNCETCGAVFNRRDKLTRHKLMHETRKKFKCPFKNTGCTREFYRKDKLKDHMLSHSRKVYLCGKCGKSFSWPTRLRHHQAANHPEMLANTTCHNCNKIFKTKHHLKIHLCKGAESVVSEVNQISKRGRKRINMKLDEDYDDEEFALQDVQEIVLYSDCDMEEGGSNGGDKQDAMLSALSHQENDADDPEAIILTRYDPDAIVTDEMTNEENSEGVLGTMEITFGTTVDTPMDPLMAGD